ncbi:MAG: MarR family transcriptional regulator [Geminicoccaceae bacterium]|jgi:DNA-binding MarR family transcriptional regulator|nr:MarR family transcriptional regulator [Geminicoccaceae bacterium]HRY23656.1 MarR family transcriptional regulator [Geminicoccaceae bacterium]
MASADDEYVLEQQVGHLLRRANQRHTALFARHFAAFDLTPLQFAVLMKLQAAGPLSQNHLGRLTAMDPNTAQGVILRLLRRRLVMRQPSPEDRRRKLLSLTEAGAALASRLKEEGRAISEATLAPLTARERRQLLALLARLV